MKANANSFAYGPLTGVLARRVGCPADFGTFTTEEIKRELLARVLDRFGRNGLVETGREVAAESAHPFVLALLAQPTLSRFLIAWMQIEVLAHAHNRVRVLDLRDHSLHLRRVRLGERDGCPLVEEDMFILGVLQGFLARLGLGKFTLSGPIVEEQGHVWQLGFEQVAPPQMDNARPVGRIWCADGEIERSVFVVAANRVASEEPVDLATVARHLGLSSRSLQRRLAAAGTSFSNLMRAARVTMAGASVVEEQQTALTDIAYRFGFADSAHMCRAFREVVGCSPSQLARVARIPPGA
ncbi:MAG: helix-turn-helix transcriptional regulator [Gallionella sp.]|nr:helix-turn-helix transcriptional regulator [Gallionella sp.]